MRTVYAALVFGVFAISLRVCDGKNEDLVAVVVVYRHGSRTIIEPYPKDPYRNESYWPVGFGQLTNQGKLQHLELGQWLRKRYEGFLPSEYSEKDIYVRSTDVDRTLMSAEANLAGLYPPKGRQVWDSLIPWQPIPIHTKPVTNDPVLAMQKRCPKYVKLLKELMNSDEFREILKRNQGLFDYLNEHTGGTIVDFDTLEYLYNTLTIEKNYNFTLPEWTKAVYPDKMKPLADFSFAVPSFTREMARLKTGPFLDELLTYLHNASASERSGDGYVKMRMYSGHDTTIANVLQSLGLFQYHSPPYRSTILFELRKNLNERYVNVLYMNETEPQRMTLDGCTFDCPLDEFYGVVAPISVDLRTWENECKLSVRPTATDLVYICLLSFIALAVTVFVVMKTCCKPKMSKYSRIPDVEDQV